MQKMETNPIIKMDFPDPDVIRVEDTYYMISTTMHFMPGGVILRSYDLIHWEIAGRVFEHLDSTSGQRLLDQTGIYGKGMWAASIRFHHDRFYVCFVANDTGKTYLYTADRIEGEWKMQHIEGFYHDCSLFFDDDDRAYLVYGNTEIHLTELNEDLSGPRQGGLNRVIISERDKFILGYEGSHFYKIGGKYYVFLIHAPGEKWFRREACFMSESLEGEFLGGDVLSDDLNYCNQGVAQGGIVDTPDGTWYSILFQDRGAVGRVPVLVPIQWKNDFPVFGMDGKAPIEINTKSTKPEYQYKALYADDDFRYIPDSDGRIHLKEAWEFNHEPDENLWSASKNGEFRIKTGRRSLGLESAINTLTQRTIFPDCYAEVSVDGTNMNIGDYAGICAFQGCYAFTALKREFDGMYLVMVGKPDINGDKGTEVEYERMKLSSEQIRLKTYLNFQQMKDEAKFYYETENGWKQIGVTHQLYFKLDHFCGCRFGLFCYATEKAGGSAAFRDFKIKPMEDYHAG